MCITDRDPKQYAWLVILVTAMVLIMGMGLLLSCNTTGRLVRKTDKYAIKLFDKDSLAAVKTLGKYIPTRTDTRVQTRYVQGKTDTLTTTVTYTVNCDSAITATIDEMSRRHVKCPPCPPAVVRVDTVFRDSVVWQESPLTEQYRLQAQRNGLEADTWKARVQRRVWWIYAACATWLLLLLVAGLLLYAHARGRIWDFAGKLGRNG